MWRSKKFIIVAVLAAVILVGSIGGFALAQTENGDDSQPETLLDRVVEILSVDEGVNITSDQLRDAFTQAQSEMRVAAMENRLQSLVDQGKIEQSEADQYLEWWDSRPEDLPMKFGGRMHGSFRGMGGPRGYGGLCVPTE